jgi:hypothetical protein
VPGVLARLQTQDLGRKLSRANHNDTNRCVAYSLRSKTHRMCLDKFYAGPERLRNSGPTLATFMALARDRESYELISGRTVLRYPHLKEVL